MSNLPSGSGAGQLRPNTRHLQIRLDVFRRAAQPLDETQPCLTVHIAGAEIDEPLRRLGNDGRMSLSVRVFYFHRPLMALPGPQISAVFDCSGQIFLGGLARYAQLIADFLDRIARDSVQNQGGRDAHGQVRQDAFEFVDLLGLGGLIGWIVAGGGSELREHFRNVHRDGLARAPHRMLMNHMAGDGEKIGFGAADALVSLDPQ